MLAIALAIDAAIGDPDWLWVRLPHPVVLVGRLLDVLDRTLNRPRLGQTARRIAGVVALIVVTGISFVVGLGVETAFAQIPHGWIGTTLCVAVLLAGRSLYDHVAAVAAALDSGGLDAARDVVARIVGRDPSTLDEAGVCRAAIESAAENFSDGLVAPAFWFAILGLPGLAAYKAINTADSMIGHRSPRYADFGWASARLDDLVNLPASRLAGALLAIAAPLVGGSIGATFETMRAEAPRHRSPNAGWPEAATAAALDLALAGPRRYQENVVDDPFVNPAGREAATADDIRRALRLYLGAWGGLFGIAAIGGAIILA
ncbi:MAG: cobalamin biosynthesis protein [Hyphomicrobiales bacterium]|nr:cobalamin biosynthesis protein [Hyphomicrobiales bacterium]